MGFESNAERGDSLREKFTSAISTGLALSGKSREDLARHTAKNKDSISKWFSQVGNLPSPENLALTIELINPPEELRAEIIDSWIELQERKSTTKRTKSHK